MVSTEFEQHRQAINQLLSKSLANTDLIASQQFMQDAGLNNKQFSRSKRYKMEQN
jgi:hypothetical protein